MIQEDSEEIFVGRGAEAVFGSSFPVCLQMIRNAAQVAGQTSASVHGKAFWFVSGTCVHMACPQMNQTTACY